MTNKRLAVHGLVAAIALIAAFLAFRHGRQPEQAEPDEAEEVVADYPPESLKGLTYRSETRTVEIDLSGPEPHLVTETTRTKVTPRPPRRAETNTDGGPIADAGVQARSDAAPAAADSGASAPADGGVPSSADGGASAAADGGQGDAGAPEPAEPEERVSTVRYAGSKVLDELVQALAPLRAARRLGKLTPAQLEEFELAHPAASLELELPGGVRRLEIGARTFGAGSHYYVLDGGTGEGLLLSSKAIRDLEMAQTRLMQREMNRFDLAAVSSAVISVGERRRELQQRSRESLSESSWVDAAAPDDEQRSKTLTNWMRQLVRLRALAYPSDEDRFSGDGAARVVRIEYKDERGQELGFVEIVRTSEPSAEFLGRSEATGSWVRLSRTVVEQLEGDLGAIVGSE